MVIQKRMVGGLSIFILLVAVSAFTATRMINLEKRIQAKGVDKFTIMKLEKPVNEDSLAATVHQLIGKNATADAVANLHIDYWFMLATYPGIALALLLLRKNTKKNLSALLLIAAVLQALPWIFDLIENNHLLGVLAGKPLGIDLALFKLMVRSKFDIAIGGALFAAFIALGKLLIRRCINVT